MKRIKKLTLVIIGMCMAMTGDTQVAVQSIPVVQLNAKQPIHDFGRIAQGKPVYVGFEIRNPSAETLSISDVQASCGCTTPEWSRQPIAPGSSAVIRVGYNAAAEGAFEKTIQVFYGNGQVLQLTIRGDVWKTPDQPAPANKSIALLKNIKF
ncbi:MAG: DUF1573 domain-containing protein [Bacteroidetes bacterium]|nr:DUF1573 domain-containing protein [Bacteroidota bacterium]